MALLENIDTHETTVLRAQHIVGRNLYACHTVIDAVDVSRSHATIYWSQGGWLIQDHSRNGTLIDGVMLRHAATKLEMGAILQFGNAIGMRWKLLDTEAPCSFIHTVGSTQKRLLLDSCRALPDENQPEALFYVAADQTWHLETSAGIVPLSNGAHFAVAAELWAFVENECLQETVDHGHVLDDTHFCFFLSPDEEDIRLVLHTHEVMHDLGRRTFNFMLLTLARKRLADHANGIHVADQGWLSIESLERQVGKELGREIDCYYLNLQVFRLRKQLLELKPFGNLFSDVIERRLGEMRFAFPYLKVIKEEAVIGEIVTPVHTAQDDIDTQEAA
jgi:FHA domain